MVDQDFIDQKVRELNAGLYGPKFCKHCQKTVPVMTHKLAGSDYTLVEGTKVAAGFVGSRVCSECFRTIDTDASGTATPAERDVVSDGK